MLKSFSKKQRVIILFLIFTTLSLHSKENNFLLLQPYFGAEYGTMNEYLTFSQSNKIISQLEWEQKPLYLYGLECSMLINQTTILLKADSAIPLECGRMYDSDFLRDGTKHNYCILNETADKNFNVAIELSQLVFLNNTRFFFIEPSFIVHYAFNSFCGTNAYGWFNSDGAYTEDDAVFYKKGSMNNIDYYRHSLYFFVGFNLGFNVNKKFLIKMGTFISPFTFTSALDTHYDIQNFDKHFWGIQQNYFSRYKFLLQTEYKINNTLSFTALVNLFVGTKDTGKLYTDYLTGTYYLSSQKSASDILLWYFTLGAKINLIR